MESILTLCVAVNDTASANIAKHKNRNRKLEVFGKFDKFYDIVNIFLL